MSATCGGTQTAPQYATPEVVAGRHCTRNHVVHKMIHTAPRRKHSPAPPPGCDCVQERFGTPRMSPRPRVAKYGVSHGANHLRGWRNARLRSSSRCVGRCAPRLKATQGDASRHINAIAHASAEGHEVACQPCTYAVVQGLARCLPKLRAKGTPLATPHTSPHQ